MSAVLPEIDRRTDRLPLLPSAEETSGNSQLAIGTISASFAARKDLAVTRCAEVILEASPAAQFDVAAKASEGLNSPAASTATDRVVRIGFIRVLHRLDVERERQSQVPVAYFWRD